MIKKFFISVLVLIASTASAQQSKLAEALKAYSAKDYDKAKTLIDEVTMHSDTLMEASTWYYRGFIYKDWYKMREFPDPKSLSRIVAIEAFKNYLEMEWDGEFNESAKKAYKYTVSTLYNDAAGSLNRENHELALENYNLYRKYIELVKSLIDYDLKDQEIQFYLVLGSVYTEIYEIDKQQNVNFKNKIINTYKHVIDLNLMNYSGHYNLGILYYNEAVNIIKGLDYETDIVTLPEQWLKNNSHPLG